MQAQKKLVESSGHPSQEVLNRMHPPGKNNTDTDQTEKLSLELKAQLTADKPEFDSTPTKSRSELYMESATIKSLLRQLGGASIPSSSLNYEN